MENNKTKLWIVPFSEFSESLFENGTPEEIAKWCVENKVKEIEIDSKYLKQKAQ